MCNNTLSNGTASPAAETEGNTAAAEAGAQLHENELPQTQSKEVDFSIPYCPHCDKEYKNDNGRTSCCGREIDLEEWQFYEATFGPPPASLRKIPTGTVDPTYCREKTSRYRGVSRSRNRWRVLVCRNGRQYSLGRYEDQRTAAEVYDNGIYYLTEAGHIKPYLRLNFPENYTTSERPGPFSLTRRLICRFDLEKTIFGSSKPSNPSTATATSN